jgi:hypothetical protein
MSPDIVLRLFDIALSLVQSQLDKSDVERTIVSIIQKGVQAYQDHKGQPLDPKLVGLLKPV